MTAQDWSAARLRKHFLSNAPFEPCDRQPAGAEQVQAAVLVPLITYERSTTVLLTRRTDHLHHHAGQISFPGGRRDPGDDSIVHTALREAQEEVGVTAEQVEILGTLPILNTPSGFHITPVVGLLQAPLSLSLDSFEVAEAFEAPLSFLADPRNYQRHRIRFHGTEREVFAVPFGGRFIWGATAGMLAMLAEFLASRGS